MRTIPLLGRRSKYGAACVFSLFIVITSFYQYIPERAAYALLKIPYILLLCLGMAVIGKLLQKTYRLSGLSRFIFALAALLTCVYGIVSIWRFTRSGYAAARPSLYLAMASILGIVMFFAADSGTFPLKYKSLNLVIISSELNIMQLIIGAATFGGIRSSSLLENIMVYDCFMLALIPQLFQIICQKSSRKGLRILAELNVVAGASIVLISGARSAALLLIPLLLFSAIVCCVKCRIRWKACGTILLSVAVCVSTMVELDLYSARNSIERIVGWSLHSGETTPGVNGNQLQSILDKAHSGFDLVPSAETSASIQASNGMRQALWKSSMEEIKKSPLIGTGTVYFDCQFGEIVLQEGSHNFILEMWLVFGGMGLLIICAMMAGLFLWGLKNLLKRRDSAIWMLLSAGGILVLAMVQPLMSMVTVTSFFWVLAGYEHRNQAEARLA